MTRDEKEDTNALNIPEESSTSDIEKEKQHIEDKRRKEQQKLREKVDSGPGVFGPIVGLGGVAIALLLIIIIVGQVGSVAPTLVGTTTNTTVSSLTESFGPLQLAPIVMIVIVAGVVIGILTTFARS